LYNGMTGKGDSWSKKKRNLNSPKKWKQGKIFTEDAPCGGRKKYSSQGFLKAKARYSRESTFGAKKQRTGEASRAWQADKKFKEKGYGP